MVLNNSGQVLIFTFMVAVVIGVLALAFAPSLQTFVENARQPTTDSQVGLDCSNSSISDFDKANCAVVDMMLPYFVATIIAIAGIVFGIKVMAE